MQINPALTSDETISVRVQITETGDFLATPANVSPRIVNVIIDSSGPGILTLATTPDAIDEVDGKVTARIISEDLTGGASATYTIGENPTAEIVLQDNDDPILPSYQYCRPQTHPLMKLMGQWLSLASPQRLVLLVIPVQSWLTCSFHKLEIS